MITRFALFLKASSISAIAVASLVLAAPAIAQQAGGGSGQGASQGGGQIFRPGQHLGRDVATDVGLADVAQLDQRSRRAARRERASRFAGREIRGG